LGKAKIVDRLEIHWPDGRLQVFEHVNADRYLTIRQGEGLE
jgi:ASPIC and UnbV